MGVSSSIKVAVRVRPFIEKEKSVNFEYAVEIPEDGVVIIKSSSKKENIKALEGYNACIFAYGATCSGKTYSLTGKSNDPGIIPRVSEDLFQEINNLKSGDSYYSVKMSYYEIYNERIRDLLASNVSKNLLSVREHPITGPYVNGLCCPDVSSTCDIFTLLELGNNQRSVAATVWNESSSRSHTTKYSLGDVENIYRSQINIVDLAGSERQSVASSLGNRLNESCQINKSLFTLGKVITQLSKAGKNELNRLPITCSEPRPVHQLKRDLITATPSGLISNKSKKFISYRDSVLTWILRNSLGGNSFTVMLATISPYASNAEETLNTLRYAKKASAVINSAIVNEDPKSQLIRELIAEIRHLRSQLNVTVESGSPRALEAEKLKELIALREQGIRCLRRKLTQPKCFNSKSKDFRTDNSKIDFDGSKENLLLSNLAFDTEDILNTNSTPLHAVTCKHKSILTDISTNIGHSLLCSPDRHCEIVGQLQKMNDVVEHSKTLLHAKSMYNQQANIKIKVLEEKIDALMEELDYRERLLENTLKAFDKQNDDFKQILRLFHQLNLRKT